ncbi:MAG: DNA adenine methylase [Anaerolineae bacterium]|nr:DNA adenine methylase [Anaerolineae bacterium]
MHTAHAAGPFIKWVGGKGGLLEQFEARGFFPEHAGAYFEPFVGGGAVFFHLRARDFASRYVLSDANPELVNLYRAVRDDLDAVVSQLEAHEEKHSEEYFYHVRGWDRNGVWASKTPVERAARMIYLNRTCFNGLWRVNASGQFNVPVGRYDNPHIVARRRLLSASIALQGVEVEARHFHDVLEHAVAGDFIYFDPPYVPLNKTSSFTGYAKEGFGEAEQEHLARVYRQLDERGCRVMLSNSYTDTVLRLYDDFHIHTVKARRAINANSDGRGPISEVVVLNY